MLVRCPVVFSKSMGGKKLDDDDTLHINPCAQNNGKGVHTLSVTIHDDF